MRPGDSASSQNVPDLVGSPAQDRDHPASTTDSSSEPLYHHPRVKIVSFFASGSGAALQRRDSIGDFEEEPGSLSWSSRLERTIAIGPLTIYRSAGSVAFLKCGSAIQPILRKSQCWCVDELGSQFVLQIRRPQYWRIELPLSNAQEEHLSRALREILEGVLQFEKTHCPFKRTFTVVVPEQVPTIKRPWKPVPRPAVETAVDQLTSLLHPEQNAIAASYGTNDGGRELSSFGHARDFAHGAPDTISQSFDNVLHFFNEVSSDQGIDGEFGRRVPQGIEIDDLAADAGYQRDDLPEAILAVSLGERLRGPPLISAAGYSAPRLSNESSQSQRARSPSPVRTDDGLPGAAPPPPSTARTLTPLATGSRTESVPEESHPDEHPGASWTLLPPSPPMSVAGLPSLRPRRLDEVETSGTPTTPDGTYRPVSRPCSPRLRSNSATLGHQLLRPLRNEPRNNSRGYRFYFSSVLRICKIILDAPGAIFHLLLELARKISLAVSFQGGDEGDDEGERGAGEASKGKALLRSGLEQKTPDKNLDVFTGDLPSCSVRHFLTFEEERTWGLD